MQIGSPNRAIGYLFTQMPRSGARFDGHQVESFAGLIEGLFENRILAEVPDLALRAALASADGLKVKLEHLLAEKTAAYDELQRKYADLAKTINEQASSQVEDHRKQSETFEGLFNTRLVDHETTMAGIQRTFNEGMKLRGPVGYWKSRRTLHTWLAVVFGIASFGAIAGLGYSVWTLAHELFGRLKTGENPSSWQLASLILFAVFGAWAGRLIVRLFLSNSHLATDAAERVVMTQTYLALVEESKLSDEKDRSLVLASLFRPGSDGIVKEESIPHPALDLLTRFGGKP
jgi:hypothetical protein